MLHACMHAACLYYSLLLWKSHLIVWRATTFTDGIFIATEQIVTAHFGRIRRFRTEFILNRWTQKGLTSPSIMETVATRGGFNGTIALLDAPQTGLFLFTTFFTVGGRVFTTNTTLEVMVAQNALVVGEVDGLFVTSMSVFKMNVRIGGCGTREGSRQEQQEGGTV